MIKIVPISRKPNFIIVARFGESYILYHLDDLSCINKSSDVGVWNIKYKKNL